MKNKKLNSDNNYNNKIDNIIKNSAIDAANIEKVGAAFLSFGYSTFIPASDIDILEALDKNNTGVTSFNILAFGQKFTALGYLLLYIAASKRLYEKTLANSYGDENNNLLSFQIIRNSYIGSFIVNYLRLIEFTKEEN